jgi:hypothetical protein
MLLPQDLRSLTQLPRFWSDYFGDTSAASSEETDATSPYGEFRGCHVNFPVGPQYGLTLSIDADLSNVRLGLRHPEDPKPVPVAGYHQGEPIHHGLRWEELDLLGRYVALADPDLPHPGLPVLLLCPFAPICLGEDADVLFPLLESAWRSLSLFTDREIDRHVERFDRRQDRFTW